MLTIWAFWLNTSKAMECKGCPRWWRICHCPISLIGAGVLYEIVVRSWVKFWTHWLWDLIQACFRDQGTNLSCRLSQHFLQHCGATYSTLLFGTQIGLENYWNGVEAVIAMSKNSEMARKSAARGKDDGWPLLMSSVSWLWKDFFVVFWEMFM